MPEVDDAIIRLLTALDSISAYADCLIESLSGTASIIISLDFATSEIELENESTPFFGKLEVSKFLYALSALSITLLTYLGASLEGS